MNICYREIQLPETPAGVNEELKKHVGKRAFIRHSDFNNFDYGFIAPRDQSFYLTTQTGAVHIDPEGLVELVVELRDSRL